MTEVADSLREGEDARCAALSDYAARFDDLQIVRLTASSV